MRYPPLPGYRIADIRAAVCRHFDLSEAEIRSRDRAFRITRPRQVAMYLARRMTLQSTNQVANAFGLTNHTTVLHAEAVVRERRRRDPEVEFAIREIVADLKGVAR